MLVISPESSCDVCLEHFALDGHQRAPHAPRCGHVFCLRYGDPEPLQQYHPIMLVPLSRIDFDLNSGASSR